MTIATRLLATFVLLLSALLAGCGGGGGDQDTAAAFRESGQAAAPGSNALPIKIPNNLWKPPAGATLAAGNYVYLQSDAGDFVGLGGTNLYTQANSVLIMESGKAQMSVGVRGDQRWDSFFVGPDSLNNIKLGYYPNLQRFPLNDPTKGGLTWFGEGRGCTSTLSGWFAVDSVTYSASALTAIEFRFEQKCEGATGALRGKIRWSASDTTKPPGPVNPPPSSLWQAPAGATPATGNYIYLQGDPGDYVAGASTHLYTGANSVISTISEAAYLQLNITASTRWTGRFQGMTGLTQLQPGYYGGLLKYPLNNPAKGGLDWSGNGQSCNTLTGWFAVDSVTYSGTALTSIALRFEQHCNGATPALRGQIRWSANDSTMPPGPADPPPPGLWQATPGTTPASGNYVHLQSDADDYIGLGQTNTYTNANAVLNVSATGGHLMVGVNGNQHWNGDFQAMLGLSNLQPGYYGNLERYPFHNPAIGGLDWSGDGRGCNTLTGWFVVDSVTYANGTLSAIEVRFEQHCSGLTPALRGQIRWSINDASAPLGPTSPPPVGLWQPAQGSTPSSGSFVYLQSDIGDYIGQGQTYTYTASNATLTVSATGSHLAVAVNGAQFWNGEFQAMNGLSQLQPGYYGNLQRYPFHNPAFGGLDWYGQNRGCNTVASWFVVDSVAYDASGLASIDLRFEQHCEGMPPALHGRVRWAR